MKSHRYHLIFVAVCFSLVALLYSEKSIFAEKKVLKTKSEIVKGISKASDKFVTRSQILSLVAEIEPNNDLETAQPISPPSPSSIEGQADTSDVGDFLVTYDGGVTDDFEDLFRVTINTPGINISLTDLQSDLDIFVFDDSLLIHSLSTGSGVVNETIANDTLEAGSYFLAVSIFDLDTSGPSISDYTLTVTGDLATPTSVAEGPQSIPTEYLLSENYPNPFNPTTKINYAIAEAGRVQLKIYNALGQEIAALVDDFRLTGDYEVSWDGTNFSGSRVSSGLYFYKIKTADFSQTKKMILLK